MNWVYEVWRWAERLMGRGGGNGEIVFAIVLVLGVVLLGSWVQSRIAQ